MRAIIATTLDCSAAKAWNEVRDPRLLVHVMRPMVTIVPLDPPSFPDQWRDGATHLFRGYAFGFIPLGVHHITFERVDDIQREIQTRETNAVVRLWNHRISIAEKGANDCDYQDDVDVSAGLLTPFVWLFAHVFYRHRQKRWRVLARRL